MSEEFQAWCKERGITHLTGAPHHPATNGAAERLIQTFKQALRKSQLPPKKALPQFLMQYRRTPTSNGYSPSELLNGRQIRTKIDTLLPSPAHVAQGKQVKEAARSQRHETVSKVDPVYNIGDPVYALYYGPRQEKEPRWVPAIVVKRFGSRSVNVRVFPKGPTWRRHLEQLRPRYVTDEDYEPGEEPSTPLHLSLPDHLLNLPQEEITQAVNIPVRPQEPSRKQDGTKIPEYGPHNPRRSKRTPRPPERLCLHIDRRSGEPKA